MPLLRQLNIEGFRGCPESITVDFCRPKGGEGLSAIILGDNGTGKSTIIDAIVLALLGTYISNKRLRSASVPSLLNLRGPSRSAVVNVVFDDNTSIAASLQLDDTEGFQCISPGHPQFQLAPIALRRKDILTFLETPEEQRQIVFLDFFRYGLSGPPLPDSEETRELKELQLRLKNERRSVLGTLLTRLNISPDNAPKTPEELDQFVRTHVYRGLSRRQRSAMEFRGQNLRLNPELVALAKELTRLADQVRECQRKISKSKAALATPRPDLKNEVSNFFAATQDEISRWFLSISTSRSFVKRVLLVLGEISDMSLSVKLELVNGHVCTPHNILSEANLDLLALLLFLAVAKEASKRGQAPVLMLDDVLQSVDASIRVAFAEFLLNEFKGWQIIITVHDRLWHSQLREIFRRAGHQFVEHNLSRWGFQTGFVLQEPTGEIDLRLQKAIDQSDVHGMCGIAGLLLEAMCDRMSVPLEVSVVRRREDKYTLGDLWPGVSKKLKKTNAKEAAGEVDRWIHLRNLVGAHFNEWAQALSASEAEQFAAATLSLYRCMKCTACKAWLEPSGRDVWQCRCGSTTLRSA
jgi:hypothetical protein